MGAAKTIGFAIHVLFWSVIALLTAGAVLAVLLPLGRRHGPAADAAAHDREVYRDQLSELEREQAEGRIPEDEAEAARAEIARRLIAADREIARPRPSAPALWRRRMAAVVALAGVPAVALGLYLPLGTPDLPGQPLQARLEAPASGQDLEALIARVEEHLARNPQEGRGWEIIAPVYMRLGRYGDAERAWRNVVRILGSTAEREAALGEAIVGREGGIVTSAAREAFERAHAADPAAPRPRFFLALAKEQEGALAEAAADWRALLADAPSDAPWRAAVEEAVARAEARIEAESALAALRPGDGEAAGEAQAAEEEMIDTMVAGLAARLETEPGDVAGWLRLIRAYSVLGREHDALEAGEKALNALTESEDRRRIETLLADLGLALGEATP